MMKQGNHHNTQRGALRQWGCALAVCLVAVGGRADELGSSMFAPPVLGVEIEGTAGQSSRGTQQCAMETGQSSSPAPVGGFGPPSWSNSTTAEPIYTAWDCRTEVGFQPSVLRFGVLPPPPLPQSVAETMASDLECYEREPVAGDKPQGHVLHHPPASDCRTTLSNYDPSDFSGDPIYDHIPWNTGCELQLYGGKHLVPTQHPLMELGVPFYRNGPIPAAQDCLGPTNLVQQKFYVYGDYRVAFAQNNLVGGDKSVLAQRLNLELDYWITSTERMHMFVGPFQEGTDFMRLENGEFFDELNFFDTNTDTLFFEGDLGQILGGIRHEYATFDLPFTAGLVPMLLQNGIWMQDAMIGLAATLPARNSPALDWSNYDVTFFAAFDKVSSLAFPGDEDAGQLFGATTFIESRGGYFEGGYAYVNDTVDSDRSYHNIGLSYTRRYLNAVSNSMRVIINTGQQGSQSARTADGVLLLAENTLITPLPYNLLPYVNVFAGFDRPQPAARAGAFGGVLFNTGILFQSDLLTGYPTLDATGNNTYGVATGVDLLGPNFEQQLIVEVAAVGVRGPNAGRSAPGDQSGVGMRYQVPITNAHLLRFDAMYGWLDNSRDISGARAEFRWKF